MTKTHTLKRPTSAPGLYETEKLSDTEKLVCEHYFLGSADWFVIEYDPIEDISFGYVRILKDCEEYGYFSMKELEELVISSPINIGGFETSYPCVVERDDYWKPVAITTVIAQLK